MQIHQRIKKERLKQKLSEEEVAMRLGIKRSTYQYWETTTPNVDKVKAVAKALGFEENYFFVSYDENGGGSDGQDDENTGTENPIGGEDHGTKVPGTIMHGGMVLVEAKDLTASYERIIEEKERVITLIKSQAEKAEKDKDRLFKALENAQKTINEVLKPIKEQTQELLSNSKETAEDIAALTNEIQAEHRAMMDSVDVAAKQPIGTTRANARTVELAYEEEPSSKDKKIGVGKKTESGKKG